MNQGLIIHRYAKALFESAHQKKEDAIVLDQMKTLLNIWSDFPSLQETLESPIISIKRKLELLLIAIGGKKRSDVTTVFLNLVLRKNRQLLLNRMARTYIDLWYANNKILPMTIISITHFNESILDKIKDLVIDKENVKQVEQHIQIDKSLIGGFILQFDSLRVDASVIHQLKEIKESLQTNL